MNKRKILKLSLPILIICLIIYFIDYSGKIAQKKRYEQYKTEPVTVETIAMWDHWEKTLLSTTESVHFPFKKEWIPKDEEDDLFLDEIVKVVGDTTVKVKHVYLGDYEGKSVYMRLAFEQNTKKLQGKFMYPVTFENKEMPYDMNWIDIPETLTFLHQGQEIEIEDYIYIRSADSLSIGIPYRILEQYDFQIDVIYTGLAVYEYQYVGF